MSIANCLLGLKGQCPHDTLKILRGLGYLLDYSALSYTALFKIASLRNFGSRVLNLTSNSLFLKLFLV